MKTLVVVAHVEPGSFTHGVANAFAEGVAESGHQASIADLEAEGFDARYSLADRAYYQKKGDLPEDVRAQQVRIDAADAIALVYPIFWWSMPALAKGWVDRVFTGGWAYDYDEAGELIGLMAGKRVRILGVGSVNEGSYRKRGYDTALRTQIDAGIFNFCGLTDVESALLLGSEDDDAVRGALLDRARTMGRALFSNAG